VRVGTLDGARRLLLPVMPSPPLRPQSGKPIGGASLPEHSKETRAHVARSGASALGQFRQRHVHDAVMHHVTLPRRGGRHRSSSLAGPLPAGQRAARVTPGSAARSHRQRRRAPVASSYVVPWAAVKLRTCSTTSGVRPYLGLAFNSFVYAADDATYASRRSLRAAAPLFPTSCRLLAAGSLLIAASSLPAAD
jgi:hypothetical protein